MKITYGLTWLMQKQYSSGLTENNQPDKKNVKGLRG
jgi:hypothetical protein